MLETLALPLAIVALFALGGAMMLAVERFGDRIADVLFAAVILCVVLGLGSAMVRDFETGPERVAQREPPTTVR